MNKEQIQRVQQRLEELNRTMKRRINEDPSNALEICVEARSEVKQISYQLLAAMNAEPSQTEVKEVTVERIERIEMYREDILAQDRRMYSFPVDPNRHYWRVYLASTPGTMVLCDVLLESTRTFDEKKLQEVISRAESPQVFHGRTQLGYGYPMNTFIEHPITPDTPLVADMEVMLIKRENDRDVYQIVRVK